MSCNDHHDIVDVTVAYCYALDEKRFDDLASVFTDDAIVDYGTAVCVGVDAVIDKVSTSVAHLDATTHLVSNHRVAVDGDRATCSCYLISQHVRKGTLGGDHYMIAGRYDDELVRTPDGWRISSRRLTRVWSEGNRETVNR
jgi:3-phenylpropionate/cinnamic acid dioxygenase small subunit